MNCRELTAKEKRDIKELVTKSCANYCGHYKECLPLDSACYMLNMYYWKEVVGGSHLQPLHCGSACKYFKSSVLPLNPSLEASLYNPSHNTKSCVICSGGFTPVGNQATCSKKCSEKAKRNATKERIRKHRQSMR